MGGAARKPEDPVAGIERHREQLAAKQAAIGRERDAARAGGAAFLQRGDRPGALQSAARVKALNRQAQYLASIVSSLDGARISLENKRITALTMDVMSSAASHLGRGAPRATDAANVADSLDEQAGELQEAMSALTFDDEVVEEDDLLALLKSGVQTPVAAHAPDDPLPPYDALADNDRSFLDATAAAIRVYPEVPTHAPADPPTPPTTKTCAMPTLAM